MISIRLYLKYYIEFISNSLPFQVFNSSHPKTMFNDFIRYNSEGTLPGGQSIPEN